MGCPKLKKDGTSSGKFWGADGAKKLLLQDNWRNGLDKDVLGRNTILIELPCPLWNVPEAMEDLEKTLIKPKDNDGSVLNLYGLTAPLRKLLQDKAERDAWIGKMRAHLQVQNEKAMKDQAGELTVGAQNIVTAPAPRTNPTAGVQAEMDAFEFFGFLEDYDENNEPEKITKCMALKHTKRHIPDGQGAVSITCDKCNYGYKIRSTM